MRQLQVVGNTYDIHDLGYGYKLTGSVLYDDTMTERTESQHARKQTKKDAIRGMGTGE